MSNKPHKLTPNSMGAVRFMVDPKFGDDFFEVVVAADRGISIGDRVTITGPGGWCRTGTVNNIKPAPYQVPNSGRWIMDDKVMLIGTLDPKAKSQAPQKPAAQDIAALKKRQGKPRKAIPQSKAWERVAKRRGIRQTGRQRR